MRRFAIILAGLGVITTGLACQHTAGKCDCSPLTPPCMKYGLYTSDTAPQEVAPGKIEVAPPAKTGAAMMLPSGNGAGSGL